jgi:mono/diheme cytochrome c family protein
MWRRFRGALAISLACAACSGPDADLPPSYRTLQVPEARLQSAAAAARGRELFLAHCALCHGVRADGHGVRSEGLSRPPADFTDPDWRRRVSARRVFFVIREGVHGTPMPAWKALEDDQVWDLVAYLLQLQGELPGGN